MRRNTVFVLALFLCTLSVLPVFPEDAPAPYTKEEFPPLLRDIRRAEIITLGAVPFVTFNVTLGYSISKYASHNFDPDYFPNPFAKTSDANAYTTDEQIGIILTSAGISLGIGIADLIVHIVKRNRAKRRLQAQHSGPIKINPLAEAPEAFEIDIALPDAIVPTAEKAPPPAENKAEPAEKAPPPLPAETNSPSPLPVESKTPEASR